MQSFFFAPRRSELITVLLVGLLGTAVSLTIAWALTSYFIVPVFCKEENNLLCNNPYSLSFNVFMVLNALVAVGWFARERIFRPALVALPALVMFWSLPEVFTGLAQDNILIFSVIASLLVAISYMAFYWFVRIKQFVITFIVWLVLIIGLRVLIAL